jgi:hypothetical protein
MAGDAATNEEVDDALADSEQIIATAEKLLPRLGLF